MTQDPVPSPETERPTQERTGRAAALSFGRYRLLQRVGEGGMGEVWLAEQTEPVRRQVALKVIKAGMDSAQVVARFEAERQALALMDHPTIATVFDGGTTPQGRPYFAMEYVKGEPITAYCDRHRLTTKERLQLFTQVCEGVQHAHQKGIIHRDLKPSNVLVSVQGERPVPKIIDFGVAKAASQQLTDRGLFTELGVLVGTPEYMSPEQAEMGSLDIDTRTDIYALGVLLYELLTGSLPFDREELRAAGFAEIQRIIREKEPPRPSARITQLGPASAEAARNRHTEPRRLVGELRGDLDWITMRALEKDRTRRYQTANALAMDVRRHLANEPVAAGPPSAAYKASKFVSRHRSGVGAAATLVVLLVAFGVTMAAQARRIARERDRANREADAARQVSDFLVGLFKESDPDASRGRTVTAREVLDRGAARIGDTLEAQPGTRVRLLATIGSVYTSLGLYGEAEPLLERAVREGRRALGDRNPETLKASHALADLYWYQDQFTRAEPIYREVIEAYTQTLGAEHPETLRAQFDLASLYLGQSRWEEGEQLTRATLAIQTRVLGPTHDDTISSLTNLQYICYKQQRYSEALPIATQVLEVYRRKQRPTLRLTVDALHNVATIYDKLGRVAEAERAYREVIATKRRVLGEGHDSTSRTEIELASMYERLGRFGEAAALRTRACGALSSSLGATHPRTLACVTSLVRVYEAAGHPEQAREWRAKATGR